jgi:hypothetical protein
VVPGCPCLEFVLALGVRKLEFDAVAVGDVDVARLAVGGLELPGPLEPELFDVPVGDAVGVGNVQTDVDDVHTKGATRWRKNPSYPPQVAGSPPSVGPVAWDVATVRALHRPVGRPERPLAGRARKGRRSLAGAAESRSPSTGRVG